MLTFCILLALLPLTLRYELREAVCKAACLYMFHRTRKIYRKLHSAHRCDGDLVRAAISASRYQLLDETVELCDRLLLCPLAWRILALPERNLFSATMIYFL